ncbi:MAG: YifB family Mg chelatase-like AAA ATPase [Clostridia bacterium]|nr:YifB family Mg chelatase-like AAA ATPase [Clostridia bacterium]
MLSKIYSRGLSGIDGFPVSVETDISNGMPAFDIVGLPDTAVKEAKERVRSAIKNTGFKFPAKHIVINLAPASQRKEGSGYDLPMALSILTATEQLQVGDDYLEKCAFFGELSLDGSVNSINGVLPMVISAYRQGITDMFVPAENAGEAAVIEGVNVYPVESLKSLCDHFCDIKRMEKRTVDVQEFFRRSAESILDFCDVKGQENVKRALEIAAAGTHNVLLIGSPGTGKTMLAQRMPSILPDLTFDEALEVTKIHSISGLLSKEEPLILKRPFRSPHHTISPQGLSGGGAVPKPGELSLAHNGILFLDELPEFRRDSLESLRQPLEDGIVTISRVSGTLTYPCNIMLISSMNPCKCGYLGDPRRQCTCTPQQINRYRSKISGPLLNRIDIQVEVSNVDYDDLSSIEKGEKSAEIKKRVNAARKVQLERYEGMNIYSNSQLDAGMLQKYCVLGDEENAILRAAFDNLGLSARAHSRILKVARTIADLEGSENIRAEHIAEAIQYRSLDRKYFE